MTMVAEPKPFLEQKLCGGWLALVGQFFWLSALARVLAQKSAFGYDDFTVRVHNLYKAKPPFASATFNR
jgi:hypothetical protein